ncbi:MAG: bile acid:sodium symporter family protein [Bacteroidetes bacterium]|nr:bile acid:sodium symporter family protein [Bacteroidota bacterium]
MGNSALSEIFMLLILAFIMFGVGLTLSLKDFRSVFIHPRALIAGLFAQMILLPVIAFAVAEICSLSPELKTGLIIISVCPGGATSNLITYLLKGDAALAVSLTITNSILILFSIPAVIFLALSHYMLQEKFIELPIASTVLNIFLMAILPVAIGVMIRNRRPVLAKNVERPMKYIMPALLGIIFLIAAMQENPETEQTSADLIISVLPWVAILNLGAMFAGYFTARVMKLGKDRQISLAVEVGIQNSALAITIASNPLFLGNAIMAVPALAYGLITFITAIIFGILINKNIL